MTHGYTTHGYQPGGGDRPPVPTTGSGVHPSPLDEALRIARAASHSRRLDTATQAAIDALVAVAREQSSAIAALDLRLRAIESARIIIDP